MERTLFGVGFDLSVFTKKPNLVTMWFRTCFSLLLVYSVAAAFALGVVAAGKIDVDPSTVVIKERSIFATASFSLSNGDIDLFNMPSFILSTALGVRLAYTKTEATQRKVVGGLEVVWHGSLSEANRFGLATLIQKSDGNLAGIFSTETSAFTLTSMPAGSLQLKEAFWVDAPEDSDADIAPSAPEGDIGDDIKAEKLFSGLIVESPKTMESITSGGKGVDVTEGGNRSLKDGNRSLQAMINVDVLILITNRALCETAKLPVGCDVTNESRAPIEGMVKVVEEQTNTAMSAVGVNTKVTFVRIVHLSPGYDGRPSGTTLQDMRNSNSIADWRTGAGADLVSMVTGADPDGLIGGLSYLKSPESASRYVFFVFLCAPTKNDMFSNSFIVRHCWRISFLLLVTPPFR